MRNKTIFYAVALLISCSPIVGAQVQDLTIPTPMPVKKSANIRVDATHEARCFGDLAVKLGDHTNRDDQYKHACIFNASKLTQLTHDQICVPVYIYEEGSKHEIRVGPLNIIHLPTYLPESFLEQAKNLHEIILTIPTWPKQYVLILKKEGIGLQSFDYMRKWVVDHEGSQRQIRNYLAQYNQAESKKTAEESSKPESKESGKQ